MVDGEEEATGEGTQSEGIGNRLGRPRGHKASKQDLKREANTLALQATFKGFMAEKLASAEKKPKERERKLDLEEEKARSKAIGTELKFQTKQKEVELKLKEVELNAQARTQEVELKKKEIELHSQQVEMEFELKQMVEDNHIITVDTSTMDLSQQAWIERRRKMILERDA